MIAATRLSTPISELGLPKRARTACEELGIQTVSDALRVDRAAFLAVPGCGVKTFEAFEARVREFAESTRTPALLTLLPSNLLEVPIARLFLPDEVVTACENLDIRTISQLVTRAEELSPVIGADGVAALRDEIGRLVERGATRFLDDAHDHGESFRAFFARLSSVGRDHEDRDRLRRRLGIGCTAETRWQLATKAKTTEDEVAEWEHGFVSAAHATYGRMLERLRQEIVTELETFEGVLTGHQLAPATILRSAALSAGDPDLPLRVASFLFPSEFHHHDTYLSTRTVEQNDELIQLIRRLCRTSMLPRSVDDVRAAIHDAGFEVPHDLVCHVARTHLHRSVQIDPLHGEMITVQARTVADRLQQLIEDRAGPTPLDELLFDYREQFRRSRRGVLRDHLRGDERFLEVGVDLWSLRDRHLDELDIARVEASRIRDVICEAGGRHSIVDLSAHAPYAERQLHIIADLLRHDATLRDLGRLEFCPRHQEHSKVMSELLADMSRAMGEIPLDRFLSNQPKWRRTLVATLLRRNRQFVSPTPDRVDLLTNYPFDRDRIRRVLIIADQCLEQHGGYSTVQQILEGVQAADLGGAFLTEHLMRDLLVRHGRYEFLPGGIVAEASLGLTGWIQQRAREAIRSLGHALTPDELILERPELAEFGHCLRDLLDQDPLLVRRGDAFQVS